MARSKPLKILVLSAKGWGTGSALRAFYLAQALRERGHRVTFVKPLPTLPFWIDMALSLPYTFLRSLLLKSDAALCVKPYPMVVPALGWQRMLGATIVFDLDDLDYAYSHGWFKKFHQWLQKGWPAWADLVTYHNPKLLEPIRKVFKVPGEKLLQVPQGVEKRIFNPGPAAAADLPPPAARLLRVRGAGPLLTFPAHLNVACDLEPVLRSFKILSRSLPTARLLVAGGGPDEGRFKRLAGQLGVAPWVFFTGLITPRQVAACLKVSDAVLTYYGPAPANEHRASMKLREALACGRKVVATDVGEARLFKKALFLSKPDPASYAKTVGRALKAGKAPAAGAILVRKWDWVNCVKDLEKAILKKSLR